MEKQKRIDRKALTNAVKEVLSEQRVNARQFVTEQVEKEMEMDEQVLVLRSLQELHPSMKEVFEISIRELVCAASSKAVRDMPSGWIQTSEQMKIRGRLELLTDANLLAYTLEELTDVVKDK